MTGLCLYSKAVTPVSAGNQQPPVVRQQQMPLANPAFAHLFTDQATLKVAHNHRQSVSELSAGVKAFAAQQRGNP